MLTRDLVLPPSPAHARREPTVQYESWNAPPTATTDNSARVSTTRPAPTTTAAVPSRFAPPKTSEEIQKGRQNSIPTKTKEDTKYCYKLWESWREYRQSCSAQTIPCLQDMAPTELNHWLSRFVVEARKTDGTEYPPNTLHHIVAGLPRHLRFGGRMLDQKFTAFQASLDGEMKRLQAKGLGINRRQAEVITPEEEETLWRTGQLGDSNPQQLLDTMIFCCGLFFALRSGREHRQLRRYPPQIQLIEQAAYLKYQEDISKNHPGGLKGRKITPKVVYHHANLVNLERCFVRLLKKVHQSHSPGCTSEYILLETSQDPNLHLLVLLPTGAQPAWQHSCKTLPVSGNLRFQDQPLLARHVGKSSVPVGSRGTTDNGDDGAQEFGRSPL